jgi:hypothetical protein
MAVNQHTKTKNTRTQPEATATQNKKKASPTEADEAPKMTACCKKRPTSELKLSAETELQAFAAARGQG